MTIDQSSGFRLSFCSFDWSCSVLDVRDAKWRPRHLGLVPGASAAVLGVLPEDHHHGRLVEFCRVRRLVL